MITKGAPSAMPRTWIRTRKARVQTSWNGMPKRRSPVLRFSPTAWAKLLWLRDRGETEIGGFGITSRTDLLRVEEIALVEQDCSVVSVSFRDAAVADHFDRQVDRGLRVESCGRIWIHTHPGDCPAPSATDEETFERVFGRADWAVMFILARGGRTYARLRFGVGPGGQWRIPVEIDFTAPFPPSEAAAWAAEYDACVQPDPGGLAPWRWVPRESDDRLSQEIGWPHDLIAFDSALIPLPESEAA